MRRVKHYTGLVLITLGGIALLGLLVFALYWLRDVLTTSGHPVSDRTFFIALLTVLGGAFGLVSKVVQRVTASKTK